MANKKKWVTLGIIVFIVIFLLAWWLVSPLFLDEIVNEELPSPDVLKENVKEEMIPESQTSESIVDYSGVFKDADSFHKTSGTALIVTSEGKKYLRLEDFQATNGPDLYVYLATDSEASDFINLGALKGNIGNQNYEISENVDFEKYDEVLIWCKAFGVLFGSAEISVK